MPTERVCGTTLLLEWNGHFPFGNSKHIFLFFLLAFWIVAPLFARSQAAPGRLAADSELIIEGGSSLGNVRVFDFAEGRRINPFGIEYDRRLWNHILTARLDYVAELLPVVLVNEPASYTIDSIALTSARQTKFGVGIAPIGFRLLWRRNKELKPYFLAKGGFLYFPDRVLSQQATKLEFSAQFGVGVEQTLTPRLGLRVGFSDFHFSNGNIARKNPGIDFMYFSAGLCYRFGR